MFGWQFATCRTCLPSAGLAGTSNPPVSRNPVPLVDAGTGHAVALFEYLFGFGYAPVRGKLILKDAFQAPAALVFHIGQAGS
jgi:hypothetical protein